MNRLPGQTKKSLSQVVCWTDLSQTHGWFASNYMSLLRSLEETVSIAQCNTAVTPLLMHWSYCSLAWKHIYDSNQSLILSHGQCLRKSQNMLQRTYHIEAEKNGCHFPDIFKCIFLNETSRNLIKISLKFVPKGPINNIPALVQIMTWHRPGDKPLSEPMMVSLIHLLLCLNELITSLYHSIWILMKMTDLDDVP